MTLKLLIADDSPSIRQMLAFSLKQENLDITEAADGAEALEKFAPKYVRFPEKCIKSK